MTHGEWFWMGLAGLELLILAWFCYRWNQGLLNEWIIENLKNKQINREIKEAGLAAMFLEREQLRVKNSYENVKPSGKNPTGTTVPAELLMALIAADPVAFIGDGVMWHGKYYSFSSVMNRTLKT